MNFFKPLRTALFFDLGAAILGSTLTLPVTVLGVTHHASAVINELYVAYRAVFESFPELNVPSVQLLSRTA